MSVQSLSDVVIRSATNLDKERVIALVFGVLAEYGLRPEPESKDADLNDIEGNYIRPGGVFELIEDRQGNLLGAFGLYPLDHDTCELRKMYFVPQIRGIGLGRHVLDRAVAHARRLGFKTITLETNSALKEAIRLYTRFGFTPMPVEHPSGRCDQAYFLKLTDH
jgi:putative acetyltransferase